MKKSFFVGISLFLPCFGFASLPTVGTAYTLSTTDGSPVFLLGHKILSTTNEINTKEFFRTTFYFEKASSNTYYLRTSGGLYVQNASANTQIAIGSKSQSGNSLATFTLEDNGISISIKSSNGNYLSVTSQGIQYSSVKTQWKYSQYTGNASLCEKPLADTYYKITNFGVNTVCLTEESDGSLVGGTYNVSKYCFWEYIPTGKEHCYYIKNAVTGRYIQSTKQSTSTLIKTGTAPIEFFVGNDPTTGATTYGHNYMSSTDNATYNKISNSTWALNKDGGSSNIIVWQANTGNKNSFWMLNETENLYDLKPFGTSVSLGNIEYLYQILSTKGKSLTIGNDKSLTWENKNGSKNQQWYFVGNSNRSEGFLLASVLYPDYTVNIESGNVVLSKATTPQRWYAVAEKGQLQTSYSFRPFDKKEDESSLLTVEGESSYVFKTAVSDFSRSVGIYQQPCGNYKAPYIKSLLLKGDGIIKPLVYPISKLNGSSSALQSTIPTSYYTLYTADKATVAQGQEISVELKLNENPSTDLNAYVYFDWDGDGVFDGPITKSIAQSMNFTTIVPSDAKIGKSRMRVRITNNKLNDAEDEVIGQIIDAIVNVAAPQKGFTLSAVANDSLRGGITISEVKDFYENGDNVTLKATPKGLASFVCWREGNNVLSVSSNYTTTMNHSRNLVAYFSPEANRILTGLESPTCKSQKEENTLINILSSDKTISVSSASKVKDVSIYSTDGIRIFQTKSTNISTSSLPVGTYIVKVTTSTSGKTGKVIIK